MKDLFSKDNSTDLIIGVIVLVCLLLNSNIFSSFMPSSLVMIIIGVFIAAFSLFAVLIWRENPRDEREAHIMLASDRLGFLAGAMILSFGLIVTTFRHESTNFLALALSAMILAKLIGKYINK